jgi:hypothetical protein
MLLSRYRGWQDQDAAVPAQLAKPSNWLVQYIQ